MTQTRRTQAERSEATRTRLLEAALQSLAELGYARTSTTEIAQRAGVSRGAQLHHFPSKNDLVAAAARHVFAARVEEFRTTLGALPDTPERFQHAIDLLWSIFQGPALMAWHELMVAARTDAELRPVVAGLADEMRAEIDASWTELFPAGLHGLPDEINAAVPPLLFAVLDGLMVQQCSGASAAPRNAEQVLALLKLLAAYFDSVDPYDSIATATLAAANQEA